MILSETERRRVSRKLADIGEDVERLEYLIEHDDIEDSDSDESTDGSSYSGIPSLADIAQDLATDTECLIDLGSRLEDHTARLANGEAAVAPGQISSEWDPSEVFIERIRRRYPECRVELAERLGRANLARWIRRQEVPMEAPGSDIDEEVIIQPRNAATVVASTTFHDSGLGSSRYAPTLVSYRGGVGDAVRIPPLPENAKRGERFLCDGCGMMVRITNPSAWT